MGKERPERKTHYQSACSAGQQTSARTLYDSLGSRSGEINFTFALIFKFPCITIFSNKLITPTRGIKLYEVLTLKDLVDSQWRAEPQLTDLTRLKLNGHV